MAFEKRAVQKIIDLDDLMNIYSDSLASAEFREMARQMLLNNFKSESDIKEYFRKLKLEEDSNRKIILTADNITFKSEIDSVFFSKSFQKKTDGTYFGSIGFIQKISDRLSDGFKPDEIFEMELEVNIVKTSKIFGEKTLQVWELRFEP